MDYLVDRAKRLHPILVLRFLLERLKRIGINRVTAPASAALMICPIIIFYLFDSYTHNPFTSMNLQTQILNIVFYELAALLLFGIFRSVRAALMVETVFFMIVGLINYYVLNFRSAPIMPWDIFSIKTAASVADNFNYELESKTIIILVLFGVLLLTESRIRVKGLSKWKKRCVFIVLPLVLLFGYTKTIQNDTFIREFSLYDKLFTPAAMTRRDGNAVAFIMEMEFLNVDKPEGYSEEETQDDYKKDVEESEDSNEALADPESLDRPNIIVIMDEAFSDLSVLGELKTNQDYMPFIHSLQEGAENTVTGCVNVSVLGGNTANSEFEFLTSNSMAFLPQGSVAYQQYVKEEMPNLVSYLKDLGYSTLAIHPYNASGWERNRVYPLLGFDEFLSQKNFSAPKKIRKYVSDEACFDKIIDVYESKEEDEPLFVFNVTMQNHSGYDETFTNFKPQVAAEGIDSPALNTYLSLMQKSDKALEELIDYFEKEEEDTIILFFGDHQPTSYISNPVLRYNNIDPNGLTEEQNMLKYKVPFVIWSNFDIEESKEQETSLNYLAMDLLNSCNIPLPAYMNCLEEIRAEYPVITAIGAVNKDGEILELKECRDALNDYQSIQYYLLFDYDD